MAGPSSVDPRVLEKMNDYEKKIVGLGGKPQLHLDFSHSRITDDDLARLEILPMVTSIDLSYTSITDNGIAHLLKYPQLEKLTIISVPITDASLAHLKEMKSLWRVDFDGTRLSREGQLDLVKFLGPRRNEHMYGTATSPAPRPGRN
ncbi:MAG: hypothetical protein K8T25_02665 [Planctomycetia bacterium]|nr:hypothetical protein [Planctomycetia bacterium]